MRSQWVKTRSKGPVIATVILLMTFSGCGSKVERSAVPVVNQPTNAPSSPPEESSEPDRSVSELLKELLMAGKEERVGMLRAWTRVPHSDHYRLAHTSEFDNAFMTYNYGEMSGAYGLAALIVDKTLTKDRYSLVVFIRRPANRYDVYWIYQNMDLSKYKMSRASGDIFVDYVHHDGTKGVCGIQWDRKERRWGCTAV